MSMTDAVVTDVNAPAATAHGSPLHVPLHFSPISHESEARVCVVAEIGVNHDGDSERAIELVDFAAEAGADAVKLQLFDPRHLLSNQAVLAEYQDDEDDVFLMLDRLKMSVDQMLRVRQAARRHKLAFVVTPFSLEEVKLVRLLDPEAVKIASPDAVNQPLLEAAVALNRPMIISTGTCKLSELGFAAGLVRDRQPGGCLLQCVSSYPTPTAEASLGAIGVMAGHFKVPVGYSDHTTDPMTGALAVAAGACVIEKHLTYDRAATGPDHASSFDPPLFGQYVDMIRQATVMLGRRRKDARSVEADVAKVSRQSVCVTRDMPVNHRLTREDLTVKRPGTGIPAAHFQTVIGRRLLCDVKANDLLQETDLA